MDKLNGAIKRNLGKSWAQLYQKQHGKLPEFVKAHDLFFELEDKTKVVKLKDIRYRSVTRDAFIQEYSAVNGKRDDAPISSSTQDQIDEDEKLAMLLQEDEDISPISNGSESAGGAWHSKPKKKSRKQRNKETAKALKKTLETSTITVGKTPSEVLTTPQKVEVDDSMEPVTEQKDQLPDNTTPKDVQEDPLVQLLLNEFHGKFFCFNDSEVRPIHLTDLCNAFEGKSSAYILIYRKCDMGDLSVFRQISRETNIMEHFGNDRYSQLLQLRAFYRSQKNSHFLSIAPPSYWKQRVDVINTSLRTRRLEFDQMMKSLTLRVYLPEHFQSDWPCLLFRSDQLRLPPVWQSGIEIDCDMSKTIGEVCSDIWAKMIEEAKKANKTSFLGFLLGLPSNWEKLHLTFQLSDVVSCPKLTNESGGLSRHYIKNPPSESSLIKDHFSHNSKVLFYCQGYQSLPPPSSSAFEVMETAPKELIITYALDGLTSNLVSTHIYLPQSFQLNHMCQYVCSSIGAQVQHTHIYLVQERKLTTTRTTVNSLSSGLTSPTTGKSKEYYVTSLWKSGLLARGVQQGLSFGQLEGNEIIIENLTSAKKSSPNSGMAFQEITRRNRLRSIRVDLENTGSLLQLQKDFSLGGKMYPGQGNEDNVMSVVEDNHESPLENQDSILSSSIKVISFPLNVISLD